MELAARLADTSHRLFDSDMWHSFKRSKVTIVAAIVSSVMILAALLASWISPQNPFDPAAL